MRSELLRDLESKLDQDRKREIEEIEESRERGIVGDVQAKEEKEEVERKSRERVDELRLVFEVARPDELERREVPEYLVDQISFEIMHDPYVLNSLVLQITFLLLFPTITMEKGRNSSGLT